MLDQSSHDSRVRWMRETTAADQAKLWDLALHGETSLEDLVPSHIPDGQEVVHIGYNSLLLCGTLKSAFADLTRVQITSSATTKD